MVWNRRVSDEAIIEAYQKHKSIWKGAKEVGLCGQSFHERVKKLKLDPYFSPLSQEEIDQIKALYEKGFLYGDGQLDALCTRINRHKATVVKKAQELGLSSQRRKRTSQCKVAQGGRIKKLFEEKGHPKGMLGKTHSKEVREEMSKRMTLRMNNLSPKQKSELLRRSTLTKIARYGTVSPPLPSKVSWKQGWREIGGKKNYYRSAWEANYARYLQWQKEKGLIKDWEHEPETFWFEKIKRGSITYLPDFKVYDLDGSHFWVEVKGRLDTRSKTKLRRFKKYFPKEKLVLIDSKWYRNNHRKLSQLIRDWEYSRL